jgi:shikimate dehydrogenase
LLSTGVTSLAIYDSDAARAAQLADHLSSRFGAGRAVPVLEIAAVVATADGLVNAAPVGMTGHPGMPIAAALLRPELWVADIVYFPLETELLRTAGAAGCHTMAGGAMAVFQAVGAFRLFTGIEPDPDRMLRHFANMRRRAPSRTRPLPGQVHQGRRISNSAAMRCSARSAGQRSP